MTINNLKELNHKDNLNYFSYYLNHNKMLDFEEFKEFISHMEITRSDRTLNDSKRLILMMQLLSPREIYQDYIENKMYREVNFVQRDYLVLNMVLKIIPYDHNFMIENLNQGRRFTIGISKLAYNYFGIKYLPKFEDIKLKSHQKIAFIINYNANYLEKELNGDEIIYLFATYKFLDDIWRDRYIEFDGLFYPILYKEGIIEKIDNCAEYLYKIKHQKPLSEAQAFVKRIDDVFGKYKDTEFYDLLVRYCYFKFKTTNYNTIIYHIRILSQMFIMCIENEEVPIKEVKQINGFHIDKYVQETNSYEKCSIVIGFLKFYNTCVQNQEDRISSYVLNRKLTFSKVTRRDKTALKEKGIGAIVSAVFDLIINSRKKPIEELSDLEFYDYMKIRCIWLIILTGARNLEIRSLKLNLVEKSLKNDSSQIVLHTLKNGTDRNIIYRGKKVEEDIYEYDYLGYDILVEVVEAAYKKYEMKNISFEKDLYLFSDYQTFTAKMDYVAISKLLKKIQIDNKIVFGSVYDILDREAYEFNNRIKENLDKPLFTTHQFRHFNFEVLRKYASLSQFEIAKFMGHKNPKSEQVYGEHFFQTIKTFKVMEDNGHLYGENKLISQVDLATKHYEKSNVNNEFIEDIAGHYENIDNSNLEKSISIIDTDTDCENTLPCAETGIGCTSCEHFITGEENIIKKDAITWLIKNELTQIDLSIQELNKSKRELLKDNKSSLLLLLNKFNEVLYRFERVYLTREKSLINGFGWSEEEADKYLNILIKSTRKIDLDSAISKKIKYLINESIDNFEVSPEYYRSRSNRKVFLK